MKPAGEVILEAMQAQGNIIVRDYGLEIAVLLLGTRTKIGGLKEFCALAALSLLLDSLVFATFYTAVLTIMVEVSCFYLLFHLHLGRFQLVADDSQMRTGPQNSNRTHFDPISE